MTLDPVRQELFAHRFSALAREMGDMLERTALSTNVKERLDFSCALLGPSGELVVNAPHIPVHLGALGLCVRALAAELTLAPGDVVVTNHPAFGGSHLPDVTVVTPVFGDGDRLLGYAACRAHHAEIGGSRPGSMPPDATTLAEEGVVIPPTRLVEAGEPRWQRLREILSAGPHPSRAVEENLADLAAQVAANHRGAAGLAGMARQEGWESVAAAMDGLTRRAEERMRRALERHRGEIGPGPHRARAELDDGAALAVAVTFARISHQASAASANLPASAALQADRRPRRTESTPAGSIRRAPCIHRHLRPLATMPGEKCGLGDGPGETVARVDFTGTAGVHPGNLNAPRAVVTSAVLYVLRLLVGEELPLNEGLLRPVDLVVPEGMLAPSFEADPARCPAVVGGNVETSQRVVEVLIEALGLAAASQGTMNNVLFGNDEFGYYETVAGGCGAGPDFAGASAVHSHMTNTRITDPEILERRYPVRLERFAVRRGSGGAGRWPGGHGVVREMTFLAPVSLSILSQHRRRGPAGAAGGGDGARGRQRVVRAGGDLATGHGVEELAAVDGRELAAGDRLVLETPGGGGWGDPDGAGEELGDGAGGAGETERGR